MSENMLFCLGEGQLESKGEGYQKNNRIFNKDVSEEEFKKTRNSLDIKIKNTLWVDKKDMTDEERESKSGWEKTGGFLKVFSYEDAWKNWWNEATQKQKDSIFNIPQFDSKIFLEITGIDVKKIEDIIEVSGKRYKLIN